MLPLDHYLKMESEHHRASAWSTSSDLPHPDQCPKLMIQGADWSIPTRGLRVVPTFKDGAVGAMMSGSDKWPVADEIIRDMPVEDAEVCEKCKQSTKSFLCIVEDSTEQMAWLGKAMSLASELLDVYYELTPEQKVDLLSFSAGNMPEWLAQLLAWCRGSNGQAVE